MALRFDGHLSYIDKFNRLKFTFLDTYTKDKLATACAQKSSGPLQVVHHCPYTSKEFTVVMPPAVELADDIRQLVGLDCIIYVKVIPYAFASKLAAIKGEKVHGVKLVLENIHKHPKYTNDTPAGDIGQFSN